MDVGELHADAIGDLPFFAAGVHEQQIFLPVIEEAEVARRVVAGLAGGDRQRRRRNRRQSDGGGGIEHDAAASRRGFNAVRHEAADALQRIGGDAPAIAQAAGELTVVDGAAAEGRFGETAPAAEFADLLENLLVHEPRPWSHGVALHFLAGSKGRCRKANQLRPCSSTTKLILGKMGNDSG